jgi:hypothetical protein
MQSSEVEIGHRYAMREKLSRGEPLLHVKVLEMTGRKGQVRVRRMSDPHKGLEEWTTSRQLLVPWKERQAFLRDEEHATCFDAVEENPTQAVITAIEAVIFASGYDDVWVKAGGTVHAEAKELREIARLAGLPETLEDLHPAAYVDRHGSMHLPPSLAERLVHAFARAHPETVVMFIEAEENEYKARGFDPGERFWHDYLRTKMPGFAIALLGRARGGGYLSAQSGRPPGRARDPVPVA